MSGKRSGDRTGAPEGARQFKQTKLDFFTSASRGTRRQEKAETKQGPDNCPIITTDIEEEEADNITKAEQQAFNNDRAPTTPLPPPPTSSNPTTSTTTTSPTQTKPTTTTTAAATTPSKIHITDKIGDLFTPTSLTTPGHNNRSAVLIHACNCVGSWGGGIALAFRDRYPAAFRLYRAHCARAGSPDALLGTALLIPPQAGDGRHKTIKGGGGNGSNGGGGGGNGNGHYIGCLFTSRRYGRARDKPDRILGATGPAMRHLMRLIVEEEERVGGGGGGSGGTVIGEVRMCRINSGLFAVPWAQSKRAIEEMELGEGEVPRCAEDGVLEVVAYERE